MEKNILIIDDDKAILDGFKELLSEESCWVETTDTGKEALNRLKNRHFHVVVMDIVLKETTGIALIKKIKEMSAETVVIMITGYPTTETAIKCFREGADDFLIKPLKKDDLIKAVERGLSQGRDVQQMTRLKRINETMESANQEKTHILKQVSREMSSVMNDILANNDALFKTNLDPAQAEHLMTIKTKGLFLKNLADNILDVINFEVGTLELEEQRFDLKKVVDETFKTSCPLVKNKPVQLSYKIEEDVPQILLGDAKRLRQLLLNLLANALRSTPEGEVLLKARLMATLGKGCHIFFTLKDTSRGIPKDKQMDVFKPSFLAEGSKASQALPSGLDLWMSKVLVEKMGGLISLHSDMGQGNEFRFSIRFNLPE